MEDSAQMPVKTRINRARIAARGTAIVLSIWIPVAIDQGYFRYNAYILPVVGLLAVVLYASLILTSPQMEARIHNFHRGFGMNHPWKYLALVALLGGILITLIGTGEWYTIHKSQEHVAALRKADSPQIAPLIRQSIPTARPITKSTPTAGASVLPRKNTGEPATTNPPAGALTQGPCSIAQIGGENNTATGGNCTPPDRLVWRTLTEQQQSEISSSLKRFSGQFGNMSYTSSDPECVSFATQIALILRAATWQVSPPMFAMRTTEGPGFGNPIRPLIA
jgi:hypothetical protein